MTDTEVSAIVKSLWEAIDAYARACGGRPGFDERCGPAALQVQERIEHYVNLICTRRMRDTARLMRKTFSRIDDAVGEAEVGLERIAKEAS